MSDQMSDPMSDRMSDPMSDRMGDPVSDRTSGGPMVEPAETMHAWIMARAEEVIAKGETAPREARDPVNQPMVNNWVEAIGDRDPRWLSGQAAPPAMAQVWTMYGLDPHRPAEDPLHATMAMLDEAGFTSVLGTNADQAYARFLRPGELVTVTNRLESVVGPKTTGVGEGYFVTTRATWRVGDEVVATMRFRVLKFRPRPRGADPRRTMRPQVSRDTAYFWEGAALGELRIQACRACGALRHPPGPVCPSCHAMDRGYVVASGRATVLSWLVHHAPAVPGKRLPLRLALVELEEGVRMVGELIGEGAAGLDIGDAVEAAYTRIDEGLTLVQWRRAGGPPAGVVAPPAPPVPPVEPVGTILPPWDLPITRTLVIAAALATRDFQDVHHDPALAIERGTRDIFLNILSTTGFVQRYVGAWAGPEARVTACDLRLGTPAYPGDTLSFSGRARAGESGATVVDVVGSVSSGAHVTARVTLEGPLVEPVPAAEDLA